MLAVITLYQFNPMTDKAFMRDTGVADVPPVVQPADVSAGQLLAGTLLLFGVLRPMRGTDKRAARNETS